MYKVVCETRDLIYTLRDGNYITNADGEFIGHRSPTHLEIEAAERLEQLVQIIDDILGDHYVDYLDWYSTEYYKLLDKENGEVV